MRNAIKNPILTRARVCFIDRQGKLRQPNGRFGTIADAKRVNADRMRRQLSVWKGVRVVGGAK